MNEFTHIDLFSGIGGFSLAAESCGFKTILFCEIDEFCQRVLQERFGGIVADSEGSRKGAKSRSSRKGIFQSHGNSRIPIIPNIQDIDGTKWRGATLLTGGFPCQPFSQAGQRRGKEDDRHLWPEMLRVIKEARPSWVIGENVAGIVRMELDQVLADLEDSGYSTQAIIIPACAKNAPHRRDRVWILANSINSEHRGRGGQAREENGIQEINRPSIRPRGISRTSKNAPHSKRGKPRESSEQERGEDFGRGNSFNPNSIGKHDDNGRYGTSKDSREFQEAPDISEGSWQIPWLEVATSLCRVDDGLPSWIYGDRVKRLKALGNAIVPQVAQEIIKCIYQIEKEAQ